MNREQAEAILDHLLAAAFELDEARAAAEILEDQDGNAASLKRLIIKLNSELLQTAYDRFPGLIPFEEFPEISSSLCWDQVQLPPSVSVAEIDRIIFSVMKPRWQKMAMVVGNASVRSEARGAGQPRNVRCSHPGFGCGRSSRESGRPPLLAA